MHVSLSLYTIKSAETQTFNATTGEYYPDRELTPVIVYPEIKIADPSGYVPTNVKGNTLLSSVKWLCNGLLLEGNDIEIDDKVGSPTRGLLKVFRNGLVGKPFLLEFQGKLWDEKTKRRGFVTGQISLATTVLKEEELRAEVLCPRGTAINVLWDKESEYPIKASLRLGGTIIPSLAFLFDKKTERRVVSSLGGNFSLKVKSFLQTPSIKTTYGVTQIDCRKEVLAFCKQKGKTFETLSKEEIGELEKSLSSSGEVMARKTKENNFSLHTYYPKYLVSLDSPYLTDSGDIIVDKIGAIDVGINITMKDIGLLTEKQKQELFEVDWGGGFCKDFTKRIDVKADMEINPIIKEIFTGRVRSVDL